jgi:outer membrane biosynthesis protein TonB
MNCPNCDNDLMVRLEPQGAMRFLRFLPMESYYCVKCGKRVTRLSGPSRNPAVGVALMVLVLAGMALAVWRSSGDREAAKPAPQEMAPATETRSAVVQAPAAQPETPPAAPPEAPPAAPTSKTVTIPPRPAAEPTKPAPPPAKPAPEPAKAVAETAKAAPAPAKPAAPPAKPAAEPAKAVAPAGLRTISAVTATVTGPSTRITVTAGSAVEGFTTFSLAGPPRFVVDLPGRFEYRGAASIPTADSVLSGVRVGAYPDKIRLVLDYAKPGADGRPAKAPAVASTPQGLVITAE